MAYKILADSNIDWGQNEIFLDRYKRRHPEVKVNPVSMTSGKIIVGVNEIVGIFHANRYKWLRDNFEPVGHIAYSYLVYDIPVSDFDIK